MNNKWENIRIAVVVFVCVFGMATCHGIDTYSKVRLEETKTERMEAERDRAKAQLELEKLRQSQKAQ
jgi:hypothetical protein